MALLGAVSPKRLDELAADEAFLQRLDDLAADLDAYLTRPRWYQEQPAGSRCRQASRTSRWSSASPRCCRTIPVVSGILAGDHLKSASDLGCR